MLAKNSEQTTAKEKHMRTDMNHGVAATTQDVLTHHLTCFGDGDIAGTMADYPTSITFTSGSPWNRRPLTVSWPFASLIRG
jgi:hypothetical protein